MLPAVTRDFTWRDGERIVRFGRGALAEAPDLLDDGYVLLTTPRAAGVRARRRRGRRRRAPRAGRARRRGGGRPARRRRGRAARGARAAGAWSTWPRRWPPRAARERGRDPDDPERRRDDARATATPAGVDPATPRVRPRIVLNDPALSASQPEADLAASAANALGHAIEGPLTPARVAGARARRPRGGAPAGPRGRPRRARARRAAGGLRHRLHRLRPAPRARPDARALRRRVARPRERGDAAPHDRRPAPARARRAGRAGRRGRHRDGGAGAAAGQPRGRPAAARPRGHRGGAGDVRRTRS